MADKVEMKFLRDYALSPDESMIAPLILRQILLAYQQSGGKLPDRIESNQRLQQQIISRVKPIDFHTNPHNYHINDETTKYDILRDLEIAIRNVDTNEIKKHFGYLLTLCSLNIFVALEHYIGILDKIFNEQMHNLLIAIKRTDLDMNALVSAQPAATYHERYAAEVSKLIEKHDTQTVEYLERPIKPNSKFEEERLA